MSILQKKLGSANTNKINNVANAANTTKTSNAANMSSVPNSNINQSQRQLPEWTTPNTASSTPEQVQRIAEKDSIKNKPNFFWGRAYSGTAMVQHNNLVLKVLICLILAHDFWNSYQWRLYSTELSNKQWVVFHEKEGFTTAKDARLFQTGADDEEIKAVAWNMVRLVIAAGSSNVESSYAEARQLMTPEMMLEFDNSFGQKVKDLKELGIYRKIEGASVRQMTEKDLPPGSPVKPTRYDVIVSGQLHTYRDNDKDELAQGPFAYRLRLVPLKTRTISNPNALLVNSLEEIDYQSSVNKENKENKQDKDNKDNKK